MKRANSVVLISFMLYVELSGTGLEDDVGAPALPLIEWLSIAPTVASIFGATLLI